MTGTKLTMNVWETNLSAAVFAVQGEAGSRQLDLTLIEDSGVKGAMSNADVVNKPLDLTGVTTPRLYIVKPDGTKVFSDGKVTDAKNGKASFVLSAQALAVSGKAECQIVLTKTNGETLKIIGLMLDIKPSDLDDAVESQDDYGALHEMVALVTQTQQEAAAWLEDANIQFDALLAANSTELDAWLADATNQAQAAISANDAAFETWFAELQEKLSGDVAADLQSQIDTVSSGLSALNASKGKASGLATLNAIGKLAQMPTAADVGAASASLVPATVTVTTTNKMVVGGADFAQTMSSVKIGPVMHVGFTAKRIVNKPVNGNIEINLPAVCKHETMFTVVLKSDTSDHGDGSSYGYLAPFYGYLSAGSSRVLVTGFGNLDMTPLDLLWLGNPGSIISFDISYIVA